MATVVGFFRTALRSALLLCTVLFFVGCESGVERRPFGYLRLGSIGAFQEPMKYLPNDAIVLRRDSGGFSAMSTLCTFDLSPLRLERGPGGEIYLQSTVTKSRYAIDGKVIDGPAKAPLPYFFLELAVDDVGRAPDTLYVKIGKEVEPSWRLFVRG